MFKFEDFPQAIKEQFSSSVRFIVHIPKDIQVQMRLFEKLLDQSQSALSVEHLVTMINMTIERDLEYITAKDLLAYPGSPSLRTLYRRQDELTKLGLIEKLEITGIPDSSTKTPTVHRVLDVTSVNYDAIKSLGKKPTHKEVYNATLNTALDIQKEHGMSVTRQPTGILYREARMMQQFSKVARYDENDNRSRITVIDNYLGDHVHLESVADGDSDLWLYEDIEYTTIINGMVLNTLEDQLRVMSPKLVSEDEARQKLTNEFVVYLGDICKARGVQDRVENRAKAYQASLRLASTKVNISTEAGNNYSIRYLDGGDTGKHRYFTEFVALRNMNGLDTQMTITFDEKGNAISNTPDNGFQWFKVALHSTTFKGLCTLAIHHWKRVKLSAEMARQVEFFATPLRDVTIKNKLWHRLAHHLRFELRQKNRYRSNTVNLRAFIFNTNRRYDRFMQDLFDLFNLFRAEEGLPKINKNASTFEVVMDDFKVDASRMEGDEKRAEDDRAIRIAPDLDRIGKKTAYKLEFTLVNARATKRIPPPSSVEQDRDIQNTEEASKIQNPNELDQQVFSSNLIEVQQSLNLEEDDTNPDTFERYVNQQLAAEIAIKELGKSPDSEDIPQPYYETKAQASKPDDISSDSMEKEYSQLSTEERRQIMFYQAQIKSENPTMDGDSVRREALYLLNYIHKKRNI